MSDSIPFSIDISNIESHLRMIIGLLLWTISTLLTIHLFISLASDDGISKIIMIAMAIGLEGAKILTWRLGTGYRLIAICLIALSVLASFGAALNIVNKHDADYYASTAFATQQKDKEQVIARNILSIDTQIDVLTKRLENLPSQYVTAATKLNEAIGTLRNQRTEATKFNKINVDHHPTQIVHDSMFALFAQLCGIPESWIKLTILMFLAIILEISIIVLSNDYSQDCRTLGTQMCPTGPKMKDTENGHGTLDTSFMISIPSKPQKAPPTTSYEALEGNPKSIDFLKAMIEPAIYPILKGRDTTATETNTSPYQAKVIVEDLIGQGIIRVQGKRLVACTEHPIYNSLMRMTNE